MRSQLCVHLAMSIQAHTQTITVKPTVGKGLTVTEMKETGSERDPGVLFPNGGWDVHHHIFERISPRIQFCIALVLTKSSSEI